MLDTRIAQTTLENALRDAILYALGQRLPSVASVALLRAVATQGAAGPMLSDDAIIAVTLSTVQSYRWSTVSIAADDGVSVIKPSDVTANGRWLAWTSPMRFSPTVSANDTTLDQITAGPLSRVILLDQSAPVDDMIDLLGGAVPAVIIQADGDDPVDATLLWGARWFTDYKFTIHVVVENLRDRREALQGSAVSADVDPGGNALDGYIKALLSGTNLTAVVDGVRGVKLGHGMNWNSEFAERRVIRSRIYTVSVTEEFPNAANDTGLITDVYTQANLAQLDQNHDPWDTQNYVVSGFAVTITSTV